MSSKSAENKTNYPELDRDTNPVAQPVYSNENLIGFIVSPSKVKDFLNQVANYQSSGEAYEKTQQLACDKPMNELAKAVSQYCWENEKCLSPTNKCGFLMFEDLTVDNSSRKIHKNYDLYEERRHSSSGELRRKSSFGSGKFPKNSTFESLSELIRYRQIHGFPSDLCDGALQFPKRAKTDLVAESRHKNSSHNFIFNPKILTFLGNSTSNSPSRFHQLVNKKTPFPPSIREDFIQLQRRNGNFPWSTGGYPVGNLPFTGDGLHYTIKQNPNKSFMDGPLNYDEYLKRYAEQKNQMQDFLLWDRLCKAENKSTSKQSSDPQNNLNDFSHLQHLETESDDKSLSSFSQTKNYYELNETTENIKGNLIDQSLNRFHSPSLDVPQFQCDKKKLSNFQPTVCKKRNVDQNQSGKLIFEKKSSFTYDSSTEESDYTSSEININVTNRTSRTAGSTCLPITRKFNCGVTLTKKFYYCSPPINALDLLVCFHSGRCLVNEFRVGHEHFGHVTFHGEIDVMGLHLDEIVDFKLKQLTLYPNDAEDKSISPGTGLKRLATVTLFKVWPMNKSKRFFITDPAELNRMKYENILRKSCQRTNSTFISYKPELGHWTFKISQWTNK